MWCLRCPVLSALYWENYVRNICTTYICMHIMCVLYTDWGTALLDREENTHVDDNISNMKLGNYVRKAFRRAHSTHTCC